MVERDLRARWEKIGSLRPRAATPVAIVPGGPDPPGVIHLQCLLSTSSFRLSTFNLRDEGRSGLSEAGYNDDARFRAPRVTHGAFAPPANSVTARDPLYPIYSSWPPFSFS